MTAQPLEHRPIDKPLDASERRLKAGFERMLNGLEGLEECNELGLRILVKELLDLGALAPSLNAIGWLVAERGITDLCVCLHSGGADLTVMLEGAVLGHRLSTLEALLALGPSRPALQLAMEACRVTDALDAAELIRRAEGATDWTSRLR